jgi:hypothetical protein
MTWPKEFGGQGRGYVDKAILIEELFRVQAPVAYHFWRIVKSARPSSIWIAMAERIFLAQVHPRR